MAAHEAGGRGHPDAATVERDGANRHAEPHVEPRGGAREILVLTPPLTIAEPLLTGFVEKLVLALRNAPP